MNKKILLSSLTCLFISVSVYTADNPGEKMKDETYKISKGKQEDAYKKNQDIITAPPLPPLAVFNLPSISFTTKDTEPRLVKVSIGLGYEKSDDLAEELKERKEEMIHIINLIAREQCYEYLNSMEGKVMFAEDIKAHINLRLIAGKIREVYFREFIIN